MNKYEYKFVEVPSAPEQLDAATNAPVSPSNICARVIGSEAQNGWRHKQILTPQTNVPGAGNYLVILEKEQN